MFAIACAGAIFVSGCDRPASNVVERFIDPDAGGHRLHMLVVGDGGPIVVLESGAQGGLGWRQVRGPVSRFATVVTYDRAGHGESEPGPQPRDAAHVVTELHAALHNAELKPPYVLVGQSLGGPFVRVFAATYPDEVCGLVLVDPSRVDHWETYDHVKAWYAANLPQDWPRIEAACKLVPQASASMIASGSKCVEEHLGDFPPERHDAIRLEWFGLLEASANEQFHIKMSAGTRDEFQSVDQIVRQAVAARPLPRVPTILIAEGQPDLYNEATASLSPNLREFNQAAKRWKLKDYEDWVSATPGATLLVAKRSGHNIQEEDPEIVINAIRRVASEATHAEDPGGQKSARP
jgi:pimeloyl-ACP methyl ester carboxylesterase